MKNPSRFLQMPIRSFVASISLGVLSGLISCQQPDSKAVDPVVQNFGTRPKSRVLLLSIDGLHAVDLARFIKDHPQSNLANLSNNGTTFSQAKTTLPSDSFPGLAAIITGGSPKTTGLYFDDAYDRALSPPGSACKTLGTVTDYTESIDFTPTRLDGGGGINPLLLPLDPKANCQPVYPHNFLRVNTVFEVVKQHGGRTAWADKHFSYDFVQGPSGHGVDDLYTPEISSNPESSTPGQTDGITSSVRATIDYDALKVVALTKQIHGRDHTGSIATVVPIVFGMNFQAVSVGQKLGGYADDSGTPSSELAQALFETDAAIGTLLASLQDANLRESTTLIITAKHGQSPIDVRKRKIVDKKIIPALVNAVAPNLLAYAIQDDIALIYLRDPSKTQDVIAALNTNRDQAMIDDVISGAQLHVLFGDPSVDSRAPDLVVRPREGVIYSSPDATKKSEHGGFSDDDRGVALLVSTPKSKAAVTNGTAVSVQQVAPTILHLLGLPEKELMAVQAEGTTSLPDVAY